MKICTVHLKIIQCKKNLNVYKAWYIFSDRQFGWTEEEITGSHALQPGRSNIDKKYQRSIDR